MRVAIVTQYYPPEPVPIPHSLAHALANRGHDVRVITAFPNYPEGKLAEGYRRTLNSYESDGKVIVRRVPIYISHSRNSVGRLLNYVSFGLSSLLADRFVREADVVYVYATQMTAAVGPAWWFRMRRTPFVLHVQDLWPESITGSSLPGGRAMRGVINAVLEPWLRNMYRRAAATIAIAPTMARMLRERGVAADRLFMIHNWAEEPTAGRARAKPPSEAKTYRSFDVMYAGNLGDLQDLETVVRAMALVNDLEGFRLHFVGSGIAEGRLKALVSALALSNVTFHGRVRPESMGDYYETSDFQIVPLKDLQIFRGTIPSKLQASLARGIPVITTVAGDTRDIVVKNGLGFWSAPEDTTGLVESFRAAYALTEDERARMGERALRYYNSSMLRSSGIDRIEEILLRVATGTNRE